MAKLTLLQITSLANSSSALSRINSNFDSIETALENTLSRDGTSPNTMNALLDMNSNRIINLPDATTDQEPATYAQLQAAIIAGGGGGGTDPNALVNPNPEVEGRLILDQSVMVSASFIDDEDTGIGKPDDYTLGMYIGGQSGGSPLLTTTIDPFRENAGQAQDTTGKFGFGFERNKWGWFPDFNVVFFPGDHGQAQIRTKNIRQGAVGDPIDHRLISVYGQNPGTDDRGQAEPHTRVGREMYFRYMETWAYNYDYPGNKSELVATSGQRLIIPYHVTGNASTTPWVAKHPDGYDPYHPNGVAGGGATPPDGFYVHIKLMDAGTTTGSGTPKLTYGSWGPYDIVRNNGSALSSGFWTRTTLATRIEATLDYHAATGKWRIRDDSDSTAGLQNWNGTNGRNTYGQCNFGRLAGDAMTVGFTPQQYERAVIYSIRTTRPDQVTDRDRVWLSPWGSWVVAGLSSYEDYSDTVTPVGGIDLDDGGVGPLDNDNPIDPYYIGNNDYLNPGPVKPANFYGAGALTVVASKHTKWSTLAIRKSTELDKGMDISMDHSTNRVLFQGAAVGGTVFTITNVIQSPKNIAVIETSLPHGLKHRDMVKISGVTGFTAAEYINGVFTVRPLSSTRFELLGSNWYDSGHTWTGGGTAQKVVKTIYARFTPSNGQWDFGNGDTGTSFRITSVASATSYVEALGTAGGNAILRSNGGNLLLQAQTDKYITLYTGAAASGTSEVARFNYVASQDTFLQHTPSTAGGNNFTLEVDGRTATNIHFGLKTKGTGRLILGGPVGTTVGAAGGASALPATPLGYLTVRLYGVGSGGTDVRIPYYN